MIMNAQNVCFASDSLRERLRSWGDGLGFDPIEQLAVLLNERFGINMLIVHDVKDEGDFVVVAVSSDTWQTPQEFALFQSGTIVS